MARLKMQFLERFESFGDRALDVALASRTSPAFARDQLSRSGTSVGANMFEASRALSAKDFVKAVGTALKELAETHYWLRMYARREWVKPGRLDGLIDECEQLLRVVATLGGNAQRAEVEKKRAAARLGGRAARS